MSAPETSRTLGELVTEDPGAAKLFERLGLDFCCGGRQTLAEACDQRGLDAATVSALLAAQRSDPDGPPVEEHDVARASITELCDHIVSSHHERMRSELPAVSELAGTVVRVHGSDHPELLDLQRTFEGMRQELEEHMRVEEDLLFPACRSLDAGDDAARLGDDVVSLLEDEHAAVGNALAALRELSGGYDADAAFCNTHRRLLRSMHELEIDLHQHIHEENNVLFGRVRDRLAVR